MMIKNCQENGRKMVGKCDIFAKSARVEIEGELIAGDLSASRGDFYPSTKKKQKRKNAADVKIFPEMLILQFHVQVLVYVFHVHAFKAK